MSSVRITYTQAVNLGMVLAGVQRKTVVQWITRKHITRYDDGYDPDEIYEWVMTTRNSGKARGAQLATYARLTRRSA